MGLASSSSALCRPAKVEAAVKRGYKSVASSCPCDAESLLEGHLEIRPETHVVVSDYNLLGSAWLNAEALPKRLYPPGSLVRAHDADDLGGEDSALARAYEVRPRAVGWGTYGEVVLARHRQSGAKRAVKSVSKARLGPQVENASAHVRHEADVLRQLDHPNIVRLHEVFEDHSNLYLAMQLCEGGNLHERLRAAGRPLDEAEAGGLLAQVVSAVRHLHARGVAHRDIKPENVLLAAAAPDAGHPLPPEVPFVKLVDFGLALRLNLKGRMKLSEVAGTPEYMAPEVIAGRVSIPFADRTDMWSLGVFLHKLLTREYPPPPGSALQFEASRWARDLIEQLLSVEPEQRPTAAATLRHPWFNERVAGGAQQLWEDVPSLCLALRAFASAPRLRRLALTVVSRETDDRPLGRVRRLFEALELECEGAASRPALERAAQGEGSAAGTMVQNLLRVFEFVDADGSGTIDWTEFMAVALAVPASPEGSTVSNHPLAEFQEDACQRAFEFLSQGTGLLSGLTLGQWLAPGDVRRRLSRTPTGGGGSQPRRGNSGKVVGPGRSLMELENMVREVEPSGAIKFKAFMEMLQATGEAEKFTI